ncbi:MAG: DTW domain-containing protein [Polyangiaceae bacterium]|nr:DTW domain-containing protein [Polyangiaceae bacterium]
MSTKSAPDPTPRAICGGCQRPEALCLCGTVTPVPTDTRVVLLQHPKESTVRIGTVRLLLLGLPNARVHVGLDFSNDEALKRELENSTAPPILLYPGEDAVSLEECPPAGKVTLLVIDGTWWQASKLLKLNPEIAKIPRYFLSPSSPSRYRIRREPSPLHVSTIEAVVNALSILEPPTCNLLPLLDPFDAFVEQQLRFASEQRARRHLRKSIRIKKPRVPKVLIERHTHLVVGYGEANAWPYGTANANPPEIIHWVAQRPATGEFFEAYIRPRFPLSGSFFQHTGLSPAHLERAESFESFKSRWEAFFRSEDELVGWGYYASSVLEANGACAMPHLDIRQIARDHLKQKLGDMHECARKLAAPLEPPRTAGRAGERLAALVAVTEALVSLARQAYE